MAAEMNIRTTITADSIQRIFGPPVSIDYRSHPGEGETISPSVIFESMKRKEIVPIEDIKKLKGSVYSYKNRKVITRWLRDVCAAFDLRSTTLCLAIQLADSFITNLLQTLPLDKCQLAAVTCLWVAAKFEEMDDSLPSLRKIVQVCDNAYSSKEVLDMEEQILSFFKWRLPHTTVINHLYLQLHILGSGDLVKISYKKKESVSKLISFKILQIETTERIWKTIEAESSSKLIEMLPLLCATARLPLSNSVEVFQIFGENLLVTRRTPLNSSLDSLPVDANGEIRFFISSGNINFVFVERGSFVLLRIINQKFLDLCELLIQEVVIHVEFLQLHSHVTALGVLLLAMCIMATDLEESKETIHYVQSKLNISVSRAVAAARLLCTKYQESMNAQTGTDIFVKPPNDILERIELCLTRKIA